MNLSTWSQRKSWPMASVGGWQWTNQSGRTNPPTQRGDEMSLNILTRHSTWSWLAGSRHAHKMEFSTDTDSFPIVELNIWKTLNLSNVHPENLKMPRCLFVTTIWHFLQLRTFHQFYLLLCFTSEVVGNRKWLFVHFFFLFCKIPLIST